MMMNRFLSLAMSTFAFLTFAGTGQAKVVADFTADFNASEPTAGWSYLWNPEGVALGDHDRYAPLQPFKKSGKLVADVSSYRDKENPFPNASFLRVESESLTPGDPARRSTDELDHYAILAYEIQPGEAGSASIANSRITMNPDARDTASATICIYVNDVAIGEDTLSAGDPSRFDVPLGGLSVGDTVYVALGPASSRATGLRIQFQIATK